jgi:hypothetical protein
MTRPVAVHPPEVADRPPRPRAVIEEDLRGLPALRAGHRTGDPRADQLFAALIDRRADRLLDELLRQLDGRVRQPDEGPTALPERAIRPH